LAGRIPGIHLNETGRQQADAVAARLREIPLAAVYASPLDRTMETAQAIVHERDVTITPVADLREVDYGEWQGAELKVLYEHTLWPGVQYYPSGTRFPSGETLGEAQMRMVQALERLRAHHGDRDVFAVVSHADLIKLACAYYIGMHMDLFQRLEIATCSVTALRFTPMGPRLMAYNDTGTLAHLCPPPPEPAPAVPPPTPL
jgi:probable phosphoglycerate mutase